MISALDGETVLIDPVPNQMVRFASYAVDPRTDVPFRLGRSRRIIV